MSTEETKLSHAILTAVNLFPGVRLFRVQAGGGPKQRMKGSGAGTPDLIGYVGPYFLGLEVKTPERLKDRTSKTYKAQLEWRTGALNDGAWVCVVTSQKEAVEVVSILMARNKLGGNK